MVNNDQLERVKVMLFTTVDHFPENTIHRTPAPLILVPNDTFIKINSACLPAGRFANYDL